MTLLMGLMGTAAGVALPPQPDGGSGLSGGRFSTRVPWARESTKAPVRRRPVAERKDNRPFAAESRLPLVTAASFSIEAEKGELIVQSENGELVLQLRAGGDEEDDLAIILMAYLWMTNG